MTKFHMLQMLVDHRDEILAGKMRALPAPWPFRPKIGEWLRLMTDDQPDLIAEVVGVHTPNIMQASIAIMSLGLVGFDPLLQIVLPRPTASLKNGRSIGWRNKVVPGQFVKRVPLSRKSKQQTVDVDMVRRHGLLALASSPYNVRQSENPFGPDDMVRIECRHVIESDTMLVTALKIGTLPPGKKGEKRGTKRDVHGLAELVADALQGVWWEDDRQIEHATQLRVRR